MPAFLLVEMRITDPAAFETYRRDVPAIIAAYGGRYRVRGGAAELMEGDPPPERLVLLEFPTMERLRAFYDAPEYQALKALRRGASIGRVIALEGPVGDDDQRTDEHRDGRDIAGGAP